MSKQQDLDRGYPQSDPLSDSPPTGTSWLAIALMILGLVAVLVVLLPAMALMSGS